MENVADHVGVIKVNVMDLGKRRGDCLFQCCLRTNIILRCKLTFFYSAHNTTDCQIKACNCHSYSRDYKENGPAFTQIKASIRRITTVKTATQEINAF